jgi:large subunit ribosomal protein L1
MPSPKNGTLAADAGAAVAALRRGRAEFRADRGGVVAAAVGRRSFAPEALAENAAALAGAVLAARPRGVKGAYLLSATLSSTMGPGVAVALPALVAAAQAARAAGKAGA